jgi:hypothetical protein
MMRVALGVGLLLSLLACRDPVAPAVPNCSDDYRPAMCMDGEEVCETDDRGCRVCTCERDDEPEPEMP